MKILLVHFNESADITSLKKATPVSVVAGQNAIPGGTVLGILDYLDQDVQEHTHSIEGTVSGPPITQEI